MPQEIANQGAVIGDLLRASAIADAGRLNDGAVIPHDVNKADESVVENREFLPAEFVDQRGLRHGGFR
jgi:hypothetical protein